MKPEDIQRVQKILDQAKTLDHEIGQLKEGLTKAKSVARLDFTFGLSSEFRIDYANSVKDSVSWVCWAHILAPHQERFRQAFMEIVGDVLKQKQAELAALEVSTQTPVAEYKGRINETLSALQDL